MRFLCILVGPLLIVGATLIFLRGMGSVLPPALGAGLVFAAGLALLWLAFRPSPVEHGVQPTSGEFPEPESYDRAALARLQESMEHPPRESSGHS
jgi:hypothetical protein